MLNALESHHLTAGLDWNCAEIFLYKPKNQRFFSKLKSSEMSKLALPDSFEYLCHGSAAIIIFDSFSAGIILDVRF